MTLASAASAALLLLTPFNQDIFSQSDCLSKSFYGTYRSGWDSTESLFLPDATCLESFTSADLAQQAHITEFTRTQHQQLVWIEKQAVEASLINAEKESMDEFFKHFGYIGTPTPSSQSFINGEQEVLSSTQENAYTGYEVLYQTPDALLLSVPVEEALGIDLILPRFWKSTIIPSEPQQFIPVPRKAVDNVKDILKKLRFNPDVAGVVNNISIAQMKNDIRFLTGEDGKSGIVSRHSFSDGAVKAAQWIKERIEDTGAKCQLKPFLIGVAPNVVCRYESVVPSNSTIIISGHYDSRGSFGSTRAPGGDDDGSGTTSILAIARTIARKGVKFHTNVELCTFAGEEQGLLGSRAYARELRASDANVTLMIQADMLAYQVPGEPLQLGLPEIIGTPEVTQLVANISAIYSPELHIGYTPACCSDHQSFYEQGFPSTQVFERAGPIADPMYHNSGDLSNREGYSFEQLFSIAKVQFATVLHAAGFELSN